MVHLEFLVTTAAQVSYFMVQFITSPQKFVDYMLFM